MDLDSWDKVMELEALAQKPLLSADEERLFRIAQGLSARAAAVDREIAQLGAIAGRLEKVIAAVETFRDAHRAEA
jgi:hypothetical protein